MFLVRSAGFKKILIDHIPKQNVNKLRSIQTSCVLSASDTSNDAKTSLYDFHVKHGGKMVSFAGHLLPVQYSNMSVSASHIHTRNSASLFDVSHMLQTTVTGSDCIPWMENLCPVDIQGMADGASSLTVFLNESGGILDDLIVTKVNSNNLYIVSNAGRMEHDKQHMMKYSEKYKLQNKDVNVKFHNVEERSLIALQGPKAVDTLQLLCKSNLSELYFMTSREMSVAGVDGCRVTRCGYTGEDGVEISMPAEKSIDICKAIMTSSEVKLAGLGARDSLRLEAGLCLYGNDIHDTVTPIEANLAWLIQKRRRIDSDFIGADVVLKQLKEGVIKRRIGLRIESGPPARRGAHIIRPGSTEVIGTVTSGCPSPSLGGNVAMGYVLEEFKKVGTELPISIRNMTATSAVVKMPFVPSKYYVNKNK